MVWSLPLWNYWLKTPHKTQRIDSKIWPLWCVELKNIFSPVYMHLCFTWADFNRWSTDKAYHDAEPFGEAVQCSVHFVQTLCFHHNWLASQKAAQTHPYDTNFSCRAKRVFQHLRKLCLKHYSRDVALSSSNMYRCYMVVSQGIFISTIVQ